MNLKKMFITENMVDMYTFKNVSEDPDLLNFYLHHIMNIHSNIKYMEKYLLNVPYKYYYGLFSYNENLIYEWEESYMRKKSKFTFKDFKTLKRAKVLSRYLRTYMNWVNNCNKVQYQYYPHYLQEYIPIEENKN